MWLFLANGHPHWKNLKSIAQVISIRQVGDSESVYERFYISSHEADPKKHLERSRSHWSIENNLHWILDVQFKEDACFIRKDHAAENMAAVRKLVINLMKNYKNQTGIKRSTNGLRRRFGWSDQAMTDILDSWLKNSS